MWKKTTSILHENRSVLVSPAQNNRLHKNVCLEESRWILNLDSNFAWQLHKERKILSIFIQRYFLQEIQFRRSQTDIWYENAAIDEQLAV